MIQGIAFVVYPVSDIQRSRSFYEGILGLKVTENLDGEWMEYDIGAGTLAITTALSHMEPGLRGPAVALEVTDFDSTIEFLAQQSITFFTGPYDSTTCRVGSILDPDGNEIILHRKK